MAKIAWKTKQELETPTKEQINQQIAKKIRERYTANDEFQMQRLGLQDAKNTDYQEYLAYINECIEWGNSEKEKHGLLHNRTIIRYN